MQAERIKDMFVVLQELSQKAITVLFGQESSYQIASALDIFKNKHYIDRGHRVCALYFPHHHPRLDKRGVHTPPTGPNHQISLT